MATAVREHMKAKDIVTAVPPEVVDVLPDWLKVFNTGADTSTKPEPTDRDADVLAEVLKALTVIPGLSVKSASVATTELSDPDTVSKVRQMLADVHGVPLDNVVQVDGAPGGVDFVVLKDNTTPKQ